MRTRVKNVARAAGVSVGTFSNVLNRPEVVRDETQAEIARLGCVRNESSTPEMLVRDSTRGKTWRP